jgi:rod shape determining protein RodA
VLVLVPAGLILLQPDLGTVLVFFGLVFALYREGLSGNVLVVGFSAIVLGVATILSGASVVQYPFVGAQSGIWILVAVLGVGGVAGVGLAARMAVPRTRSLLRRVGYPTAIAAAVFCGGLHASFEEILQPHQRERIYVLFGLDAGDPDADYNIRHSKAAIGSGGFIGKGFMQGPMTAYGFVPEQSTDFIFCTVGEEWGFIGSAFVVILFGALLFRILVIAERQRSDFTRIYAYAVASILFMHVLINVGMVLGLAPVIGIPLPFFSYGGSSLLGTTLLVFILLRLDAERFLVLR